MKEKEPGAPNVDFGSNPDEEELYFREPQQLLAAYQELEESNLFYIQNAQVCVCTQFSPCKAAASSV